MAFSLAIEVWHLRSSSWSSRFPGMDDPAFYVEVGREDPLVSLRTKSVRGNDAQWNEELRLPAVEEDQILRFRLKVVMPMIRDRVVGEAEWKVIRPVEYQEPYSDSITLTLSGRANKHDTCIGKITITVREADALSTTQHWNAQAKNTVDESDIKTQLQQHTLRGKVWKMLGHLDSLASVVGAIDQAAKLNSYLDLAWKICSSLYKAIEKQRKEDEKISDLVDQINEVLEFAQHSQELKSDDVYFEKVLVALLNQATECGIFICQHFQNSFTKRLTNALVEDSQARIDEFQRGLKHILERLTAHMQIQDLIVSSNIRKDMSHLVQSDILKCLEPEKMNAALKPLCLSGTRQDILQTISDWIMDIKNEEPNVFWLHGLAGSGKSTIAATISKEFGMIPSQRSGAFLFFERGRTVQESVIRTIAAQLSESNHILRFEISESIREYGQGAVRKDVDVQFEHLLRIPLERASEHLGGPVLIVIDALDEYGDEDTRRQLLKLISTNLTQLSPHFRIFITSRPETDIVAKLSKDWKVKSVSLDAGQDTIPAIHLYLTSEMGSIHQNKQMRFRWPSQPDIDRLSTMSEGLFVWASTLSRLLHTSSDPMKRLKQILSSDGTTCHRGLDTLYENVLSTQLDWEDEEDIQKFREVAGIILFCRIPLSDDAIDQLLGRSEDDSCRPLFQQLRSVFDFHPGCPIRPLHASFRDYLTDKKRSYGRPWSLIGFDAHYQMTKCSFSLMSQHLRFNIGRFSSFGDEKKDYHDRTAKYLSHALQYACVCLIEHLLRINENPFPIDIEKSLDSFLRQKLLLWMEVLSLSGTIWYVNNTFDRIRQVPFRENTPLLKLFNDARYFLRRKVHCKDAVSSVYISGSVLTHPLSPLDKIYASDMRIPNITSSVDVPLRDSLVTRLWAPNEALPILAISCLPTNIEVLLGSSYDLYYLRVDIGYDGIPLQEQILCHAYDNSDYHRGSIVSRDLRRIATASSSDIQIWSTEVGWRNVPEKSTNSASQNIALHPTDPNVLAYFDGSRDKSIHIVDITKKSISLTIHIESDNCRSLTWSDDGSNLAFGSNNGKTSIWYVDLTKGIATKKALFNRSVDMLCFRPSDASQILLVDHRSIELCKVESGKCIRNYNNPFWEAATLARYSVMAIFSPDGDLFATFIHGGLEIVIYETETGHEYHRIPLPQPVRKVEFTPNRERLVLVRGNYLFPGKVDNDWRSTLGEEIYVVDIGRDFRASDDVRFNWADKRGHSSHITSASFSPDETKFLTSSTDGTIHVRRTADCMLLREYWPLEHESPIVNAVWSIDGISIYYSLYGNGTLYSLSPSGIRVLYDVTQLDPSSEIRAIKRYSAGTEERIALILSDSTTSYGKSKIIVFSSGCAPSDPHNTYYIGQRYNKHISVSSDGLLAYRQDSGVVLLDLERGTSTELLTQKSSEYTFDYFNRNRPVIFPKGSRVMLVTTVTRKGPATRIVEGDPIGGAEKEKVRSEIAVSHNEEGDSSMIVPNNQMDNSNVSVSANEVEDKQVRITVTKCTIWDITTKKIIQTFNLSEPSSSQYYVPVNIAVSDDNRSIAFTGNYYEGHVSICTPVIIQVWTWTGEVYTCAIEHSTSTQSIYSSHCIDIARDNRRLLLASAEGLVMYDLDHILMAKGDRPQSGLCTTHHTGSQTHASPVPLEWTYYCESEYDEDMQIIDKNGHELLVLPKKMMKRLDPPGSSHVIRRNRLKIDANKLLEMQDWVEFFKPTSNDQKA